jgi:Ser/Thr protein kinase RdoA (MazF antagonist)
MDKRSEILFEKNEERILGAAAAGYGVPVESLKKLGSFESLVYEFEMDGVCFILKLTHDIHRSEKQIAGELDWVNFLDANGLSVCKAVPSLKDSLIEVIDLDGSCFFAYVFRKAEGRHSRPDDWTDEMISEWGRVTGRMHALSQRFEFSDKRFERPHWYDEGYVGMENYLPSEENDVIANYKQLLTRIQTYPTDEKSYGLIHSDLHHWNFFINGDVITIFDTDDCHFGWYAFDLCIPLFYVLRHQDIYPDDKEFACHFMRHFMDGYHRENRLEPFWMERIPDFLKLREYDIYSIILNENLEESSGWCRRFLDNRRQRLAENIPFIDIDFLEFA